MIRLWEKEIPYNDGNPGEEPVLFEYPVEGQSPLPCVIVLPGGGYCKLAEHEKGPVASWLNSLGIYSFALNYRLTPCHYKGITGDAFRAIRYVRYHANEFNIDPDRIGILGFSAGGHLAAATAVLFGEAETDPDLPEDKVSSRPDCAILCYPAISSSEDIGNPIAFENLLKGHITPELLNKYSLEKQVTEDTPPCFLWHTSEDECVHVANSLRFGEALANKKIPFELHVYPEGRHGLGLASDIPRACDWTVDCAKWLKYIGF